MRRGEGTQPQSSSTRNMADGAALATTPAPLSKKKAATARRNNVRKRAVEDTGMPATGRLLVEEMVWNGLGRLQAAKKLGFSESWAYQLLRNPAVLRLYNSELEVLRTSERAGNIRVAVEVRDSKRLAKTAAGNRVRLQAAAFLHGESGPGGGTSVTVNVTAPGYAIEFGRPRTIDHIPDEVISVTGEARSDEGEP